jgi:ankyrin repeat protein
MKEQFTGLGALNMACRLGHFVVARLLVESGAAINGRGGESLRSPDEASNTPLIDAIESDQDGIARWLIGEGADIHRVGCRGRTALWCACNRGNETIARMLIDRGADVNVQVRNSVLEYVRETALSVAERWGYTAIVCLLKENGTC